MKNNTIRQIESFRVQKYEIIGTGMYVFRVWEPSTKGHSTITHIDGMRYGDVSSRNILPSMETMPRGEERSRVVREFIDAQYDQAYSLIVEAYPEAVNGHRSMGQIEVY
jgi:hypothetical protein